MKKIRRLPLIIILSMLSITACLQKSETKATPTKNKQVSIESAPVLEVIAVFGESDGDSVELISLDHKMRYRMIVSIPNLGDNYISLNVGDRVRVAGEYSKRNPTHIFSIQTIKSVSNPDKKQCESTQGNLWQPQGKAQIPACISTYSDGGKPCTASSQCQGECIVTHPEKPAICAQTSSQFGCRATVENFKQHGGIMCVD